MVKGQANKLICCISFTLLAFYLNIAHASSNHKVKLTAFESCPYVCSNSNQKGVLVDLVESIFEADKREVEIDIMPHSRALKMVQKGSYDGVIGILQREDFSLIYPSKSIGRYQYNFYSLEEDTWIYTGLKSLYNRRIGVEKGSSYGVFDSYINRYSHSSKEIQLIHGKDVNNRMMELLKLNRIDSFLADKNTIEWHSNQHPVIKMRESGSIPMDDIYIGFHASNGAHLAEFVAEQIKQLRESGKLAELLSPYGLTDWEKWTIGDYSIFEQDYLDNLIKSNPTTSIKHLPKRVLRLKASVNKDSGYWEYAQKFKQLVETNSNGELSISLHFGESSEHDIVYDLAEGKIDMGLVAINNYTPFAPSAGVFALPYLFPTLDSAKQLINSEKMKDISSKAALESGVRPISFFIGGYRTLLNNKLAVKTTSDLANLKIRVPRNQLMIEAFRSWGVEPYPIAWPEVYPALSSNIIHGMDNPLNIANAGIGKEKLLWQYYKFATKIKYFLFTAPHLISEQSLLSMTKKHRDIVLEAANEAQQYSWRQTQTKELELIKQAKNGGMIFIEPYDEPSDWQAKAKATWPKMYFRVGGKKHVEETVKTINGQ